MLQCLSVKLQHRTVCAGAQKAEGAEYRGTRSTRGHAAEENNPRWKESFSGGSVCLLARKE